MRYKAVPPVSDRAQLRRAAKAVPLVPDPATDCCARIQAETAVASRPDAQEMLTFLQALGLVTESDRGIHRTTDQPDAEAVAANFLTTVFGAREVIQAVEEGATTSTEVFAAVRPAIPRWERTREASWESTWRERVERLLGWAVEFECLEPTADGYRLPAE